MIRRMTKSQRNVLNQATLALFAEHLYEGLTNEHAPQGRYEPQEARAHWELAKNDVLQYAQLDIAKQLTFGDIFSYAEKSHLYIRQLEKTLEAMGV